MTATGEHQVYALTETQQTKECNCEKVSSHVICKEWQETKVIMVWTSLQLRSITELLVCVLILSLYVCSILYCMCI